MDKIDIHSETWRSVAQAVHTDMKTLREAREAIGADMRQLDRDLGSIKALERILQLPAKQNEKPTEPIRGSGVRVPGMKHSITS